MKNTTNIIQHFLSNQTKNTRHRDWHFSLSDKSIRGRRNNPEPDCKIFSNAPCGNLAKHRRTKLLIKNMVSYRCIMVVKALLDYLNPHCVLARQKIA
jgi:hypothetical protein